MEDWKGKMGMAPSLNDGYPYVPVAELTATDISCLLAKHSKADGGSVMGWSEFSFKRQGWGGWAFGLSVKTSVRFCCLLADEERPFSLLNSESRFWLLTGDGGLQVVQVVQSERYWILVSRRQRANSWSVCSVSRYRSMIQRVVFVVVKVRKSPCFVQLGMCEFFAKSFGWTYLVLSSCLMRLGFGGHLSFLASSLTF